MYPRVKNKPPTQTSPSRRGRFRRVRCSRSFGSALRCGVSPSPLHRFRVVRVSRRSGRCPLGPVVAIRSTAQELTPVGPVHGYPVTCAIHRSTPQSLHRVGRLSDVGKNALARPLSRTRHFQTDRHPTSHHAPLLLLRGRARAHGGRAVLVIPIPTLRVVLTLLHSRRRGAPSMRPTAWAMRAHFSRSLSVMLRMLCLTTWFCACAHFLTHHSRHRPHRSGVCRRMPTS